MQKMSKTAATKANGGWGWHCTTCGATKTYSWIWSGRCHQAANTHWLVNNHRVVCNCSRGSHIFRAK